MSNKYGFKPHTHNDVIKNVRIFIDRVLESKGLSESLRMNPELESDLKKYFYESCSVSYDDRDKMRILETFSFEGNPFSFMGRKFEIKEGTLIISEQSRNEQNAILIKTTYSEEKDGHLLKSQQGKRVFRGQESMFQGYSERYSYFTQDGVEVSKIRISHTSEKVESNSMQNLQITEDDITPIGITQEGLALLGEPRDFMSYEVYSRDADFVERMNCYVKNKERDDNEHLNIFEYKGNLPISTEYEIAHLNELPVLQYLDKHNLETNEVTPRILSLPDNYASYDSTKLEGRARLTKTFVNSNINSYSPLEIKRIEALIELSDGRALEADQFIVRGNRNNTLDGVFKIYEEKVDRESQDIER